MNKQPIDQVSAQTRAAQLRMVMMSLLVVGAAAYVAFRLDLYRPFSPANEGLFWASIVWFALSAIETFNKRMGQIAIRGEAPPYMEYEGLHVPLFVARYGLIVYILYLDWKWALTLYILTLFLAVSPILENLGKALMFLWLRKRID